MNNRDEKLINKIVYLMETDDSIDAPADSVKWAKNIFRTRSASAAQSKKSVVQKVLAVLQMDLSPHKAVFGERSASAARARQMFFQAGDNSVDLRIGKDEKNFTVRGQILGEGFANCAVKFGGFETSANELSEFCLSGISSGEYDLNIKSDESEITIENLKIE